MLTQKLRYALKLSPLVPGWNAKAGKEGIEQCPDTCILQEHEVLWIPNVQGNERKTFSTSVHT